MLKGMEIIIAIKAFIEDVVSFVTIEGISAMGALPSRSPWKKLFDK